jgi:hydroxypyruvate isomerase
MRAIAKTGYDGYIGQEFSPRNGAEWVASMEAAYGVCSA